MSGIERKPCLGPVPVRLLHSLRLSGPATSSSIMARGSESTEDWNESEGDEATVAVENIGGIDRCAVTFRPGSTVLTGRNTTNRTSLLSAIADVLGGSPATLKSDTDRGHIELRLNDSTYRREYARQNGGFASQGEQYTDRRDLVDLFVRMLEDNDVRQAVERGDDLRDVLMRPVDTDRIDTRIRECERERTRVEERLEEIDRERDRLPTLEKRRSSLEAENREVTDEIADLRAEVEGYEADEEETERAEELLDDLEEFRDELRDVEFKIDYQDDRLDRLREERAEVASDLDGITVPKTELETVESEIEDLRRRQREVTNSVEDLQRIVSFNHDIVSGDDIDVPGNDADDEVTSALDPMSRTVECWTCGSEVERSRIADRLEELRDVVQERRETRREIESEIEELEERRRELTRTADRETELQQRLEEIEEEIEMREGKRETLETTRDEIHDEITAVEERVEETQELRESDLIDAYRRLSELEYERGQTEQELDEIEAELDRIEDLSDEKRQLEAQREELSEEIASLRSRIDDVEREAVEQFNEHMSIVLDLLEYRNIARIWIERRSVGRNDRSVFDLHIVREADGGSVYEDTIDTLSESEREVIGLVIALAGYLVHEVHREIPFMLLDSLESIDSERLSRLVDYFGEYVPFLIVALLPEDAETFPDRYDRVTSAELTG